MTLVKYSQFLYENIRLTSAAGTVTKGRDINTQGGCMPHIAVM